MWIAALRQGVRTLFWDRQWRKNRRGRRVYHCPKLITHWLMILSSRLATPFFHSLLLRNPSQIKPGVTHSSRPPGGQESATTPSMSCLTVCDFCVCVLSQTVVRMPFSVEVYRSRSVFRLTACLSGVSLAARCFLRPVADLLPLRCYCGGRAETCLSVPVTKICPLFFLKVSVYFNLLAVQSSGVADVCDVSCLVVSCAHKTVTCIFIKVSSLIFCF